MEGNSYKDKYYKEILDNKEYNEVRKLYEIMKQNDDKLFNSRDIADIFGKDNIASRLFKKLEVNELIECVHLMDSPLIHYKIIDKNKKFIITEASNSEAIALSKAQKQVSKLFKLMITSDKITDKQIKRISLILTNIAIGIKKENIKDLQVLNYLDDNLQKVSAKGILDALEEILKE